MPSQKLIDLFTKIRDDENAHKIVSLLHLMIHMGTKKLEGGEQALDPVCALTQELLEQKSIVKNLSELVDQQKINRTSQLEQKYIDMNKQVMDLHKKNLLISEVNKRLYTKCKRMEGEYEELCQSNKSIKEDMKEQRSLMLALQQRLESLEAKKNTKDDSEDVKREDVKPCPPIPTTTEELKEQKPFRPDLQQRFDKSEAKKCQDALLDKKEDKSKPRSGQKKLPSSLKTVKENVTEAEKEKQRKMTAKPQDAPENKAEKKACSATAQEPLKPGNRTKNCSDRVAACTKPSAKAKQVSEDNNVRKPRNPIILKVRSDKLTNEKKTTPDNRKPRVDSGSNLKDTKPVKVPLRFEKKETKVPPIVNKDKTTFQRPRVKENVLPGRVLPNRCRTTVTNAVPALRGITLKRPVLPQTTARTRTLKCPPVERKPVFQYSTIPKLTGANASQGMAPTESVIITSISPLPPVKKIPFKRDQDFSSWKHDSFSDSFGKD